MEEKQHVVTDALGYLALRRRRQPGFREIQPPRQGTTRLTRAPVQTDRHLAIGDFTQSSTVLTRHSHRRLFRLGEGRLINHLHVWLGQQIHHLLSQQPLDFFHGPRTLPNKKRGHSRTRECLVKVCRRLVLSCSVKTSPYGA